MKLPKWILDGLPKINCNTCNCEMKKTSIYAIGYKEIDGRGYIFIEMNCEKCNKKYEIIIADSTLETFAQSLLEVGNNEVVRKNNTDESKKAKNKLKDRSKIKQEELDGFKQRLDGYKTFSDFLRDIGINTSNSDIDKEWK